MEVRCSNCSTEYEFDDALVSARGTSVKCTNCGHQFRVHAPASKGVAAETWVVRDAHGKETTFTSLRDLQQGIVKGQLNPQHQLSHAGQAFRRLEDIYELQTFFNAARQRPPARPAPRTLLGVGRGQDGNSRVPTPSSPPPRRRGAEPPTQERVTPVAGVPAVKVSPGEAAQASASSSAARPAADAGSRPSSPRLTPVPRQGAKQRTAAAEAPWQHLPGLRGEPDSGEVAPGSGAASRWIALVVVLGALALIAGTVGREYFLGFIRPQAAAPRLDERVPALLEQARLALGRGELDAARAELAKASVLAAAEPQVVAATAQLELTQAEQSWLLLRVGEALEAARATLAKAPAPRKRPSEADVAAEARAAEQQLADKKQLELSFQDRMTKAKAAVANAVMRAPNALDVVRARVDALRLEGQLKEARTLVSVLSAEASDPHNAYSLGALDLAEGESGYPSAIDRLRVAARAEEALGKARGLLILVLAQTGDAAGASAELEKLETLAPQHRALTSLRALVDVAKSRVAAPREPAPVARRPAPSASATTVPAASGDGVQAMLAQAASLHRQGDLSGAERVYQNVLTKSPNNIPALSGLGDISRQRRATATAAAFYDRILEQDPSHVATLMARADLYWHSGNRAAAVAMYRRALSQVGPSDALGQRALRRIEEFDKNAEGSETEGASESEGSGSPAGKSSAPAEGDEEEPTVRDPLDPEPIEVDEPEPTEGQGSPPSPSTPSKTAPKGGSPAPAPSKDTEGSDDAPPDESTETP